MNTIITADSSPYPPVKVTGENVRFAAQLSSAFGGSGGEFGTIAEYVFQSMIFRSTYPEYADIFGRIAMVEMRHLDMIGELMKLLGLPPVYGEYENGVPSYWNGTFPDYTDDLASAILHDLDGEQKAYAAYVSLSRRSGDRYVFAVLSRIALDEMIHVNLLRGMLAKLRKA